MIGRARLQFAKQSLTSRCPGPREILADRMAAWRRQANADDDYARETFTQPREQARQTARAFLSRWPTAAYMTEIESWHELPGGEIELTMKRLRSAD